MNKKVLDFVNKLEGYKTAIKQLHWDADNMSQHELCDDIAESIAEFQDTVSEVEQSITGKLKVNSLKPTEYKIKNLKSFVQDVLDETNTFYKEIKDMGDTYVGMASDCESFLSDMQRKLYLVNFTLKEELKERLRGKINESMPKNLANHDEVDKFMGRRPKTMKARINQIYRIVKRYGIDSKLYHDDHWQAKDDYYRAITSLGCDFEMRPCGDSNRLNDWDDITSDGGYCDYGEDGMPRSKQYAVKIMYDDGMNIGGYIKFMAAGRVDDPFSAYDTCMILWPKNNRMLEDKEMNKNIKLTEAELKQVVKEAAVKIIKEGFWDELSPEKKDFLRRGGGSNGEFATPDISSLTPEERAFLDGAVNILGKQMRLAVIRDARKAGMSIRDYINSGRGNVTEGISETPLNYDVDNFSGRWNKSEPSDEEMALADSAANGDYLDNPYDKDELEQGMWDDAWENGDDRPMQDIENEYSWNAFDRQAVAPGVDPYYNVMKTGVPSEIDKAIDMRNRKNDWRDNELRHGRRMMDKWVNGQRDNEDLEDGWDDLQYINRESKEPMKVTEAELKNIVKEAAMRVLEKIEIDPKNKGKFTATKKATGKSTEELTHSKNPLTRKRAIFAQNAKKWNNKK